MHLLSVWNFLFTTDLLINNKLLRATQASTSLKLPHPYFLWLDHRIEQYVKYPYSTIRINNDFYFMLDLVVKPQEIRRESALE